MNSTTNLKGFRQVRFENTNEGNPTFGRAGSVKQKHMVGKARLGRPTYLEDKTQAEQSDEIALKWLIQPQSRPKGITPVSGHRRPKAGRGQWRREVVVTHSH